MADKEFEALIGKFQLDDTTWLETPKVATSQLVGSLVQAGALYAEAEAEHAYAKARLDVFEATRAADLNARAKGKLPAWRVDVEIKADPKWAALNREVIETQTVARKLSYIIDALKRKAWYIGLLFDISTHPEGF